MKKLISLIFFSSLFLFASARKPSLIAGPMAGHTTPYSAKVWLLVKNTKNISVGIFEKISGKEIQTLSSCADSCLCYRTQFPAIFSFSGLIPNTEYGLKILLDNSEIKNKFSLKTLSANETKDFSFLLGSCAMIFPKFLWPFFPKNKDRIFEPMKNMPADFMLWLGDNTYFRKRNHRSLQGMYKRQYTERKRKRINNFLQTKPQYAIWDDHDYGPNDSDGKFKGKDNSLKIHQSFWANPSCGTETTKGIFSHFRHYDAEFILTDNRYYRTRPEDENPTLLGEEQIKWMLSILKNSDASFKFIVTGSQVLNEKNLNESYSHFPSERQRIFDFIRENTISGVIFLTGDRHHSELLKMNQPGNYPFYDFTCSPLSGIARPTMKTHEATNPLRIENTLVTKHNFGKISISGEVGNRVCTIETYDEKANEIWEYTITEKELKK